MGCENVFEAMIKLQAKPVDSSAATYKPLSCNVYTYNLNVNSQNKYPTQQMLQIKPQPLSHLPGRALAKVNRVESLATKQEVKTSPASFWCNRATVASKDSW